VPDLPWTARAEMEPGTGYLVMASHLPLKRVTATVRFFRAVSAVRKQLATAEGLIGYTLRAKPLARDYWTLSVWTDATALRQFMRTPPHVQIMTSLKPVMGPTKFDGAAVSGLMIPPALPGDLFAGRWRLISRLGAVSRTLGLGRGRQIPNL
jgi:quinol monooxygenase YgiN